MFLNTGKTEINVIWDTCSGCNNFLCTNRVAQKYEKTGFLHLILKSNESGSLFSEVSDHEIDTLAI